MHFGLECWSIQHQLKCSLERQFQLLKKTRNYGRCCLCDFVRDPKSFTGNFYIDEEILRASGVADMKQYACNPEYEDKIVDLERWMKGIVENQKKMKK
ncbi:hypothetical protein PVAND_016957 [Polypedilum vanderplanki]|uniref:Uncharacterized protein n=1 Tax=Polypedilum vanderplanki TaxID=319348 RepID=A0A9J6BHB2_POLVA|nr:hypothetical protein PVAND_016957 [Polypedilum vanderplanki]